ncbi:MAG: hypothetical protein GXY32_07840 [Ruminococcaceae bacterium]|nr:hypothetical protein [Oscillospiraceae bacterium]
MDELEREYTLLFNGVTDTIKQLDRLRSSLVKLQQNAEELYLCRIGDTSASEDDETAPVRPDGGGFVCDEE